MNRKPKQPGRHYRTVWISDVHLGFRGCSADYLLEFLHSFECDTLYLVGDIIDLWQIRKRPCWPQVHNNVVRTILGKARSWVFVPARRSSHSIIIPPIRMFFEVPFVLQAEWILVSPLCGFFIPFG